jgi:DNA-binding CsgD family transcriptional regulator
VVVEQLLPPDLVEALGRLGDHAGLRACESELQVVARRSGTGRVAGWAAHAGALAAGSQGDPELALEQLELALECATGAGDPFELGRVLVTIGQSHRRLRRKRPARAALERAAELFTACGAEAWAQRARGELARVGGRMPAGRALTVTERRVCERAAEGRSNAEIGAELYLSRRTVEVNLARAYVKLGIRRRAQLALALAPQATPPGGDAAGAIASALAVLALDRSGARPGGLRLVGSLQRRVVTTDSAPLVAT